MTRTLHSTLPALAQSDRKPQPDAWPRAEPPCQRVRVNGKFFARGEKKFRVQGVTYGPFAPNTHQQPFPNPQQAKDDFERMAKASINALRLYHFPPVWLLESVQDYGLSLFIDIPWSKHLCFLDSATSQAEARQAVRDAVTRGKGYDSVFAYSIANEIPANIVRWQGRNRVERFLGELVDVARQADAESLVTYASFPPTEYLDIPAVDFVTFNVYLHDRDVFRRYLHRLQNLVGDKPLLLGELGMDSLRHGELAQAEFQSGHLREMVLAGLAGAFVFSWTDDWHTGGHQITDWAFGITDQAHLPKPSYHAIQEVFEHSPAALIETAPKVSVVVCTFNGGATLEQCVESLLAIDYHDFEIIVVDDGSTDDTNEILARFSSVRTIVQPNRGLSAARNTGLQAATGSIVAYTDSDCFVDPDWLTLLVEQLERTKAAAVGGPNLTPDDGWLASCVAASPGQPTHVLENDQVAEHIPGCNMAFRRDVLLALNGFDPQYKKAGDDVDICWRLQQEGHWITFAPGAFVWHHRRQTVRAYLRQQAGYGEAEALLRFQHPDRFNGFGNSKWIGVLYGASLQGIRLEEPIIYRGVFGTGMFQCLYQPRVAHWAMLPGTLEWHLVILLLCCLALLAPQTVVVAACMGLLSFIVAGLQAKQVKLPARYDGLGTRLLVMFLCYVQPLVRSWKRQRTRLFSYHRSARMLPETRRKAKGVPLLGSHVAQYWGQAGVDRTQLLGLVLAHFNELRVGKTIDAGWQDWDLELYCSPWTLLQIATAEEEHGSGKRLVRVRFTTKPSRNLLSLCCLGAAALALGAYLWSVLVCAGAALLLVAGLCGYWIGKRRASTAIALVDSLAESLELVAVPATEQTSSADACRNHAENKELSR